MDGRIARGALGFLMNGSITHGRSHGTGNVLQPVHGGGAIRAVQNIVDQLRSATWLLRAHNSR